MSVVTCAVADSVPMSVRARKALSFIFIRFYCYFFFVLFTKHPFEFGRRGSSLQIDEGETSVRARLIGVVPIEDVTVFSTHG